MGTPSRESDLAEQSLSRRNWFKFNHTPFSLEVNPFLWFSQNCSLIVLRCAITVMQRNNWCASASIQTFVYLGIFPFFYEEPSLSRETLKCTFSAAVRTDRWTTEVWTVLPKKNLIKVFKVHLCRWRSEAVERGWMNDSEPHNIQDVCFCELTWRVGDISF